MRTIIWMLLTMLLVLSSCNQNPSVNQDARGVVTPQAPNCDQEPPPPICPGGDPPPPPPSPPQPTPPAPPPTNRASIQLNRLTVSDAQEESFFEDGDEPYFVTIGFRSRFLTANSTQVFWNGYINGDAFSGLDDGAVRTLPWYMRGANFANLNRVGMTDISSGRFPEIIGAVTVAIEGDWTDDDTIASMMNDVQAALKTVLTNLIERGQLNLNDPASSLRQAVDQVKSGFSLSFWEKVGLFLGSLGNPDDIIGFHLFAYAVTDNTFTLPASSDPQVTLGVLPYTTQPLSVRFGGDGAVYHVATNINYFPAN